MPENYPPSDHFIFQPSHREPEPDAHGQAALLLTESILHSLVEANVLTIPQAIEAVCTACDVKVDVAEETGESDGRMEHSLALLKAIENSLHKYGDGSGPTAVGN